MLEVVIGDVHARADALRAVLAAAGVEQARRREGAWVVQVGDLLDRHASPEDNLATAELAAGALDVVLAGNHEAQLLRAGDHGAALALLATRGWPHAAAAAGDWLVTHAGLHPRLARGLPGTAAECAAELNDRWHRGGGEPLFDWVGPARGGAAPHGGILWLHAGEWPREEPSPWPQISGHVPQREPRLLAPGRWSIDMGGRGGRLAALVREHGGPWRPVVAAARRAALAA
ncbi:metallophosphoesterase [Candidatus Solirubrobacter pratensis]|uniref:metallophosphoesterase n=1 Tax=Candidatus Solirubrobacter pratensis TaxID=1298857 RepID=UPI00040A1580|nr:metallophosphoesterase [Candidatus Solirubrobacter pratensis]